MIIPNWKSLFAGTVLANKNLFARTVPVNKNLFSGTLPAKKSIFAGTQKLKKASKNKTTLNIKTIIEMESV